MFDFLLILSVAIELTSHNSWFFSLASTGKLPKDRASLECNNKLWKGKDKTVDFTCLSTLM